MHICRRVTPALWQLNVPDRFDSYSAGVTLLQMCIPSLRPDNNLIAFRRTLEENGESLTDWRNKLPARVTSKGPDAEGFDVLDADDRAGWDLVKSLMNKTREKRSSATGARLSAVKATMLANDFAAAAPWATACCKRVREPSGSVASSSACRRTACAASLAF